MNLAEQLRDIVDQAFAVPYAAFASEIAEINTVLGLTGDLTFRPEVRPKFFTGDPDALRPGGYLLAVSLNHKYELEPDIDEARDALNAGPTEHYMSCAHYFDRYPTHPFFNRFRPILPGMGFESPKLGQHIFFMDALPFFSTKSRALSVGELGRIGGRSTALNQAAVRAVLTEIPPAALFINGRTAFSAVEGWSDRRVTWRSHTLSSTTKVGPCNVEIAQLSLFDVSVRAVRSNFLRSIHGPNSDAQCRELGELLAERSQF